MARIALFVIYAWFGALKVVGLSPASAMVEALLARTMPFFPFDIFIVLFGLFEILIGLLFFFPRLHKLALALFAFHILTTTIPLILMPSYIWTDPFTPTLEGQYIIKNLALLACAVFIAASRPRSSSPAGLDGQN